MEERPRVTVGAMVFNERGQVLFLKSQKWGGRYIFPCGHVEFGETLESAVRREVREETGLEVSDVRYLRVEEFINPSQFHKKALHFVGHQYVCRSIGNEVKTNYEAEDHLWAEPGEALKINLEEGTRKTIEYYISSTS